MHKAFKCISRHVQRKIGKMEAQNKCDKRYFKLTVRMDQKRQQKRCVGLEIEQVGGFPTPAA